jgi:GTP cyclohydrolase IA
VNKPTEILLHENNVDLSKESVADLMRKVITLVGEDPNREGLRKTPERFEKALKFLTSGYHQNLDTVLNGATFSVHYDEMVVVKDIEFFSLCEHHLLPFFGKAHVGYLPNKKVIGLSKIARLVNMFARRLQIQERMTSQIAEAIQEKISPEGVGVIIEARHLCMQMRDARILPPRQADKAGISFVGAPQTHLSSQVIFFAFARRANGAHGRDCRR